MITPGFVVSVLATLTAGLVTLWLLYEDWAVYHSDKSGKPKLIEQERMKQVAARGRLAGDNTITAWTRYYERMIDAHGHTHWLVISVLVLGLVLGHLLWH